MTEKLVKLVLAAVIYFHAENQPEKRERDNKRHMSNIIKVLIR